MRYPLIEGQGSLGTQEANDMRASARYTEARPSVFADLLMQDYKKDVVPTTETYNNEYFEPVVLPAAFPNALVNGREAIGLSMSHNSLPHNLVEVCDAIIDFIEKEGNVTTKDIMNFIKGPDFPLGNVVINAKDIYIAYETGHSGVSLKVRGDYIVEDNKIIFTTIPYRTYRNKIKEQISENAEELEKFIEDFSDESSQGKNKLVFTVKKDVNPETAVKKIFDLTNLQTTLSYNMNFIINGTPKLCSLKDLINAYYIHRTNVLLNATNFDKDNAEKRLHILEGLMVALADIDKVIKLIKESENRSMALKALLDNFTLDEVQAKAILDLRLAKLTKLDVEEIKEEITEKQKIIEECNLIINNKKHRDNVLIKQLIYIKKTYGDERRTKLMDLKIEKESETESITPEDVVVIMTKTGYIKRIPTANFKAQKRNGKGVKNLDDALLDVISTNTVDTLMLFTKNGKMYRLLVNNIPVGTNAKRGVDIESLIKLDSGDSVIRINSLYKKSKADYVIFITKKGILKKTSLEEYSSVKRSSGIAALKLMESDSLANVTFINEEDMLLITKKGKIEHIETKNIRAIGRVTKGIQAIKLDEEDSVLIGLPIHKESDTLALFTETGFSKKVQLEEFPVQLKNGKGIMCSSESLAGACLIDNNDYIFIAGRPNSICVSAQDIPLRKRNSVGIKAIKDSAIVSVTKL